MIPTIAPGKCLLGIPVSPTKFQGVSTLDQLEDFGLGRPSLIEHSKKADRASNLRLDQAHELRAMIQRRFDAARMRRAEVYSRYIERIEFEDMDGGTPAITVFDPSDKAAVDERGLIIPYNATLIPIDGETQAEAWFMLRDRRPEAGCIPIAVTLYHSTTHSRARQVLVDYNKNAHPMSDRLCLGLDDRSPLAAVGIEAALLASIDPAKIVRHRATAGRNELVSRMQISSAAIGIIMRDEALKRGAHMWFDALSDPARSSSFDGVTAPTLAKIITSAVAERRGSKASPLVWQVAGVKAAAGADPNSFNWEAAGKIASGRGGSIAAKLAKVAASL